jgi:hypothetical protein
MLTLCENPQETLTNKVWDQWKKLGYTERHNALTLLELNNLAAYFLKICREKKVDYQEYDFRNLLDHNLNYYENQSGIAEAIGGADTDETAYKAYMAKVADEAENELKSSQELSQKNADLEKQNKKLRAKETETLDTQQIKQEMQQISQTQASILNKLEQLPHFQKQVEALKRSENFKDLGDALSPATKPVRTLTNDCDTSKPLHYTPHGKGAEYCQQCGVKLDAGAIQCWNCKNQIKTVPKQKRKIHFLDAFAGIMILIIWIATTAWALQSFGFSWALTIGLAVFWIFFIIVFRLFAEGLLN